MNLLSVQKAALERCHRATGFGYFMEQGLGKTLTVFADFLSLVATKHATRLVVVCPNSFKNGWKEEAEKQGVDLDFFIWEAGNESGLLWWMRQTFTKPPCLVVNYEAIRAVKRRIGKRVFYDPGSLPQIISNFIEPVNGRAMIAFDESIQLKNHDSLQAIGAAMLADTFDYKRVLSGKPITQGPHDLWGQMRAINKIGGRNYYAFRTAFCKMGGFKNKQVVGSQNEDLLASIIEPHVFRATKDYWTDLPPKSYTIRDYKLTPEMKAMYDQMHDEFVLWLSEDENVSVDAAITKYIKLAQIQCGWIYKEDGSIQWLVSNDRNPRLSLLREIVDTEVTGKVGIVYHHKPIFDMLAWEFKYLNPAWIKGGMSPGEISEQKTRFNNDTSCRAILLQDGASKYGHTLLGHDDNRCYTMIFFENNYSLDTRSQIEDRIHRHGQTAEAVLYLDLVGTPLDRDCVRALQRKEAVFQAVFSKLRKR